MFLYPKIYLNKQEELILMSLATIIVVLVSFVILALFFKISFKLGMHALSGFVGIFILNIFLSLANLHIPYNLVDMLIAGILGIPGLIILCLYYFVL